MAACGRTSSPRAAALVHLACLVHTQAEALTPCTSCPSELEQGVGGRGAWPGAAATGPAARLQLVLQRGGLAKKGLQTAGVAACLEQYPSAREQQCTSSVCLGGAGGGGGLQAQARPAAVSPSNPLCSLHRPAVQPPSTRCAAKNCARASLCPAALLTQSMPSLLSCQSPLPLALQSYSAHCFPDLACIHYLLQLAAALAVMLLGCCHQSLLGCCHQSLLGCRHQLPPYLRLAPPPPPLACGQSRLQAWGQGRNELVREGSKRAGSRRCRTRHYHNSRQCSNGRQTSSHIAALSSHLKCPSSPHCKGQKDARGMGEQGTGMPQAAASRLQAGCRANGHAGEKHPAPAACRTLKHAPLGPPPPPPP